MAPTISAGAHVSFTEPSAAVTLAPERERARMLSRVLFALLVFGVVTTVLQLALVPGFFPQTALRVVGALGVLGGAWLLSRTRHYRVAAWVTVGVPYVVTVMQGLTSPHDVSWWAFMLLAPLFATMFFSTRVTAWVSTVTALTAAAILASRRDVLPSNQWVAPIAFHFIYAPVLVTAAWHRRRLEEQREAEQAMRDAALAESRRMEAVGRLAGGIAHDFNNLLTVVLANAQLLSRRLKDGDQARCAKEIAEASERAAALTRQLLAFAKKQPHAPRPVDMGRIVEALEPMIRRLLSNDVKLQVVSPGQPAVVLADATQLEQVVMNLAANARDAMPSGGTLTVHTRVVGDFVELSVRDTGVGMDATTRERIFEPFFTTRERGTGLGLATTHSIVQQAGGTIRVESAPEHGSEFIVRLPRRNESVAAPAAAPASTPARGLRVLLVDDDAAVRGALARLATSNGLALTSAGGAAEALALAEQQAFDVLVTDVVMPGVRGPELAVQLRARQPSLNVVFISGHHEVPNLGESVPGAVVMGKPLRAETLLEVLARLPAR